MTDNRDDDLVYEILTCNTIREALLRDVEKEGKQVKMVKGRVDQKATASLQKMKKLKARSKGDLESAVISAGYHAKKNDTLAYVFPGNSFGSFVYRVTFKKSEALDSINNNTGDRMFTVDPDLTVTVYNVERPGTKIPN